MNETPGRYISYLLRLWQVQANGEILWRASLESPQNGKRWAFANLDDCFAFLQKQADTRPGFNAENPLQMDNL